MASDDIQRVIALMERHGIAAFDYEHGATQLHLTRGPGAAIAADIGRREVGGVSTSLLPSPGVGRVLLAHPASVRKPAALPRNAARGDVLAYIRTGTTLRAVIAQSDCILQKAVVEEGQGVGYDDPLFEILLL